MANVLWNVIDINGVIMFKWYIGKLDRWSIYHFLMGYFLGNLFQQVFGLGLVGILQAFIIGLAFEIFESFFWWLGRFKYPSWFPIYGGCELVDPRGGSVDDIKWVAIGCIVAIFV